MQEPRRPTKRPVSKTDRESGTGSPSAAPPVQSPLKAPNAGAVALKAALVSRDLSAAKASTLLECSAGSLSAWLAGTTIPGPDLRRRMSTELGVPPAAWDRRPGASQQPAGDSPSPVPAAGPPLPPTPSTPDQGAPPATGETGLAIATLALSRLRAEFDSPDATPEHRLKLIAEEGRLGRLVASLSGELEQSVIQAWKSSGEGRHFIATIGEAIRPWPEAARAVARALGVANGAVNPDSPDEDGDAAPHPAPARPNIESLSAYCGRLENWLAHDDWDPVIGCQALDKLVYPTAGHERSVAERDVGLARRMASLIDRVVPRIDASKLAHQPYSDYCKATAVRLEREANRGELIDRFRRDFGEMALGRMLEIAR
jgi:transcriptional regulator with XRE-family HTH domain